MHRRKFTEYYFPCCKTTMNIITETIFTDSYASYPVPVVWFCLQHSVSLLWVALWMLDVSRARCVCVFQASGMGQPMMATGFSPAMVSSWSQCLLWNVLFLMIFYCWLIGIGLLVEETELIYGSYNIGTHTHCLSLGPWVENRICPMKMASAEYSNIWFHYLPL